MSDTGNSVGAAVTVHDKLEPGYLARNAQALRDVYLGPGFTNAEIQVELDRRGLKFERLDDDALAERAAQAIHEGVVVGWFQGRWSEGRGAQQPLHDRSRDGGEHQQEPQRSPRPHRVHAVRTRAGEYADELFEGVETGRHRQFMAITTT
jgi:carbamoyltransferase